MLPFYGACCSGSCGVSCDPFLHGDLCVLYVRDLFYDASCDDRDRGDLVNYK